MNFDIEKFKKIIADELYIDPSQVREDARFIEDLGADSIGLMELVMKFEEEFGIKIPDEDIEKIRTVGDAINYIKSKLQA
ncbi:MAG: acyl carrier protein [candidate division WOR-3 bacterium]